MKKINKKKKVFVGVSGGVDSSVALALLKEQGYQVFGVFIRTWTPDFIDCTWRDERRDAMRVCAHLDVPFLECDAEEAYKKGVADYMINEYKIGRTPNPDVMCNREVKFGIFWQFAKAHGADFIATGHYARVGSFQRENTFLQSSLSLPLVSSDSARAPTPVASQEVFSLLHSNNNNPFILKQGIDKTKDQSYFLWTLTSEDLSHTLFPIGHLEKKQVRKLAEKFGLPTAVKKDSQGVCFLGPLDMKDFLKHYIKSKQGIVENTKGENIGTHDGVLLYTLGERHGFNIVKKTTKDKPYYIVAKDIERNILIVSHNKNEYQKQNKEIQLQNVVSRSDLLSSSTCLPDRQATKYLAQVRYHGELLPVTITDYSKADKTLTLKFIKSDPTASSGQSVVIYQDEICIAGGIIK